MKEISVDVSMQTGCHQLLLLPQFCGTWTGGKCRRIGTSRLAVTSPATQCLTFFDIYYTVVNGEKFNRSMDVRRLGPCLPNAPQSSTVHHIPKLYVRPNRSIKGDALDSALLFTNDTLHRLPHPPFRELEFRFSQIGRRID